ncbi:aldo/keto reductase [Coprinopsis cinerea okayama7|uniref:Aldo/keto reductase n=1 Tax=Coprinopsis cinerea (strain Okayama-7 / 130 / ATCC MYA-4618 / FGSC 9003) TaxID=240176 RepID=A8NIJ2_COPC7|nr:aldo/keto reductase [Coprinopsis cinerea okayama7\|eukprot:XP_001834008.1 aldo/keto reductase [Coprinopsis cinerea okayama7\
MAQQTVTQSTKLGGTASNVSVGVVAHGLMMMTWTPNPVPDEQAFEAIKAGVDALPPGTKMILNSGEFYAQDFGTANLELLSRFFAKYPDYADKTFLSVKGGIDWTKRGPDGSLEFLRKSVDNILKALGPNKKLDLFEPARIDRSIPVEELTQHLVTLLKEGKFDHIGLSECNANTLRKAHAVHPITAVEIEISPWSYEDKTKDVIATAKELGITVIAYSPLGRGFLTGQIKSSSDLPPGDHRASLTRFQEENIKHNMAIVDALVGIAKKKEITPAQLSIAWVRHLGPHVIPLPGSSKSSRTLENLKAGDIQLSDADLDEINKVIATHQVKGDRYFGQSEEESHLWG